MLLDLLAVIVRGTYVINGMKVFLFNPDTDLALANGRGTYTPTANVRRMISDLSLLPVWYATPGSKVLVSSDADYEYFEQLRKQFYLPVSLVGKKELAGLTDNLDFRPWGWNFSLRNSLLRLGVDKRFLPTDKDLGTYQHKSSRAYFADKYFDVPDEDGWASNNVVAKNLEAVQACAQTMNGELVIKRLWSSSGKGLLWIRKGKFTERDINWIQRALKEDGGVVVAPIYNKVLDFAMEFYYGGDVSFAGYSLFRTDDTGHYEGNVLMTDADIEGVLTKYVPLTLLIHIREELLRLILVHYGHCGYIGVDMLVYKDDKGKYGICPTIELNMRMNMGVVSHSLMDSYVAEHSTGLFAIRHFAAPDKLADFCREQTENHPLVVEDGRVRQGFLRLTALSLQSQNVAYIMVEEAGQQDSHSQNGL